MSKFIGVKLVDATPMTLGAYNKLRGWTIPPDENPDDTGCMVTYADGYVSWCPSKQFEKQNLEIVGIDNKINEEDVNRMIKDIAITTLQTPLGGKITAVVCTLKNGFTVTETSSCVDPKNYDEQMGAKICMDKIKDKIWFLLGFLLSSGVNGFADDAPAKEEPATVGEQVEQKEETPA